MIICICKNVSNKKIIEIIKRHPEINTLKQFKEHLDVCSQCGKCKKEVVEIILSEQGANNKNLLLKIN